MQLEGARSLEGWAAFLSQATIPVLKQTARRLAVSRQGTECPSPRDIAEIIAPDPMMTVKLLRYLQHNKHRRQEHEVVEIEQALLMMGVETFLREVPPEPTLDAVLHEHNEALLSLLRVLNRARRASAYAFDWALRRRDMHFEEVRIAALLHELAEMLMWCFASTEMLRIHALQQRDKTLRSRDAQAQVLGFALDDLQSALAREWSLPKLLLNLMDSKCAGDPRVRNVVLAVNLARHSANGWDDAALPDDYARTGEFLGMRAREVMLVVGAKAGRA